MKAAMVVLVLIAGPALADDRANRPDLLVPSPVVGKKIGKFLSIDAQGRILSIRLTSGRSVELVYKNETSSMVLGARIDGGRWLPPRSVGPGTPCQLEDRDAPNFCGAMRQQLPGLLQPRLTEEDEAELEGAFSETMAYAGAGYSDVETPETPGDPPYDPTVPAPPPPPPPPPVPCKQHSCDVWGQTVGAACTVFVFFPPEGPPIAAACALANYGLWLGCQMVCVP